MRSLFSESEEIRAEGPAATGAEELSFLQPVCFNGLSLTVANLPTILYLDVVVATNGLASPHDPVVGTHAEPAGQRPLFAM